jgi:ankyrin repeat protein
MKVLAEYGADIFCVDENGMNVLHLAAINNYLNIVQMLIKSEYPLDEKTYKGVTATGLAAKKGHL